MNITNLVKGRFVSFHHFRQGVFYYDLGGEDSFQFPVPIEDIGDATLNHHDKAIYFMRWIKAYVDLFDL